MSKRWMPSYNDEQALIIREMYLAKRPAQEIADSIDSKKTYIYWYVAQQDYYRGSPKKKKSDKIRAKAKALHNKGMAYDHIAVKLDIGRETVRRIAKADGWYKDRGRPKIEEAYPLADMKRDYESGLSFSKIKKKYEIKQDGTLNLLIKKGKWDKSKQLYLEQNRPFTKKEKQQIKAFWLAHVKIYDMVPIVGFSYSRIFNYVKKQAYYKKGRNHELKRGGNNFKYKEFIRKLDAADIHSGDWKTYRRIAGVLTRYVYGIAEMQVDPYGKRSYDNHIDHMFSVHDGLYNKVDIRLICHPANLRMMSRSKNCKKNYRSSITLEQLQTRIRKYENTYGAFEFPTYLEELCTKAMNIFVPHLSRKLRIRKISRKVRSNVRLQL